MAIAAILVAGIITIGWWLLNQPLYQQNPQRHRISDLDLTVGSKLQHLNFSSPDSAHRKYYASDAARAFCKAHDYSVFTPRSSSGERKIYDLFMVNSELDFFEIRLDALYDYVDYFVIVESPKSFQGGDKDLIIRDNWDKFARYHDKMIYHELEFPSWFRPKSAWDYEDLQRDAMYDQVIPRLKGRQAAVKGDVLLVADVDEIPRPETLLLLRTCNFPRRLTLSSRFYYYSFQFLHSGPEWPHPQATYYQGSSTIRPTNLRIGDGGVPFFRNLDKSVLANAAWHCSSCFATVEQFLNKMASFSHTWMNADHFRDRDRIADAVREGLDVWGRKQDTFERLDGNTDLPPLLLKEKERFNYMLDRDGESAGFTDYPRAVHDE